MAETALPPTLPPGTKSLIAVGLVNNGKSTLVNALLGRGLMPVSNLTCTAMAVTAVDPVNAPFPPAVYLENGQRMEVREDPVRFLQEKNSAEAGGELILRASLPRLTRGAFPLALTDTPGVNDSMSGKFRRLACQHLQAAQSPTLLYVSSVRTCGTTDEERCLRGIAEAMAEKNLRRWFAAVNGWDLTDPERDRRERYIETITKLAERCSLPAPAVFCVSARSALLCRRALAGEALSASDRGRLELILSGCGLRKQVLRSRRGRRPLSRKALRTAVWRSDVPLLENALYAHFIEDA